jgi:TolA-binding protein
MDSPTIADMHFYFGELLYDMGKFEDSAAQYRWVMENGKNSKFFMKASENTLLTLEKTVPSEDQIIKIVGETNQPVPLEPKAAAFIDTAKAFLSIAPKAEKSAEIRFRIGRLYYLHNQFDEASVYFRDIMKNHAKTKYAEFSANLLLDSFNIKKDYAGLEKAGNEILSLPTLANSKAANEVRGVLEKASFKKAQDFEASKDFVKAAFNFEAFALQNPSSNLALAALFNAAINFEKSDNNIKAVEMHQAVVNSKRPEANQFRNNSQRILAKLYQDSGQLEIAAKAFSDLASANPKDPLAQNYIFNSAILFDAIGNKLRAEQSYEKYMQNAKAKEKLEILFQIAKIQKDRGTIQRSISSYTQFLDLGGGTVEQNMEATNEIFELNFKINRISEATKWKAKLIAYQAKVSPQGKGVGAEYVARFKLAEVEQKMNAMKAIVIPSDPRKQQNAIKQKIDLINQLNGDLAAVIRYDNAEEIVGALAIVGEANQHMYQALMAVPLPRGLSPEEQNMYKKGVEQIATPFLNKSKDSYRAALERASQLEAYGRFYQRAKEQVTKVDPSAVYESDEIVFRTRSSQWIGL